MSTSEYHLQKMPIGIYSFAAQNPRPLALRASEPSLSARSWWTMAVCSSIALIISSYLAWTSVTLSPVAGCGGDSSLFACDSVLHGRWATVMSVSVSVPAMATHILILTLLLVKPVDDRMKRARWATVGFASLVAGGAALWFTGLQVFWIHHVCPYCVVTHACGLTIASVFVWNRPVSFRSLKWIAGAALASMVGLITLQILGVEPKAFNVIDHSQTGGDSTAPLLEEATLFEAPRSEISPEPISMQNRIKNLYLAIPSFETPVVSLTTMLIGQVGTTTGDGTVRTVQILKSIKLDVAAWPLTGKPDAELVFVEMFDYTCEHCQRTHIAIEGARQKFGDRLAIIALPVPLNKKCNQTVASTDSRHLESCDLAKLAVAVWIVDRSKFSSFHDYLFAAKPTYAQAMVQAKTLVDEDKLTKSLDGTIPGDFIAKHVLLYQKAGSGTIPKILFPRTTVVGAIDSSTTMIQLIEQHLP